MGLLHTYKNTIVDGPGVRYSIYLSGCKHKCIGCHNPASWKTEMGTPLTDSLLDTLMDEILSDSVVSGVTISGGDPFESTEWFLKLLKELNKTNLSIWVYSGYLYEYLIKVYPEHMKYIDVLVDGRFEIDKRDVSLDWKGSSNQRLVDVKASSKTEVVLFNNEVQIEIII